jgi:hypothetical protein
MRFATALAALAVVFGSAGVAHGQIVASCGPSKGHAFYLERGGVPAGDGGWTDDGLSSGRNIVTREANGDYDLVFSDSLSRNLSARSEGGAVIALVDETNSLVLLIGYANTGVTEIYSFFREASGRVRMSMQQTKVSERLPVQKVALHVSDCTLLR